MPGAVNFALKTGHGGVAIKEGPGPARFGDCSSLIGKGAPAHKMQGKMDYGHNKNPGPGQYNTEKVYTTGSKVKDGRFIKDSRVTVRTNNVANPGPGTQTVPGLIGKNVGFAKIQTLRPGVTSKTPGPGAYTPSTTQTKAKAANLTMKEPGFSQFMTAPTSTKHGSTRGIIIPKDSRNRPGPGAHNSTQTWGKSGSKFSLSLNPWKPSKVPGPGSYSSRGNFGDLPEYAKKSY